MNEIIIKPKSPFDGFINFFRKRTTVSSFFKAEGEKKNNEWADASTILDYSITCTEASCQWVSTNDPTKSFVVFTFECPIYLTHYTLRTRSSGNENFPVSWTVECSRDGEDWHLVDTKNDVNDLKQGSGAYHTYKCDEAFMYAKKVRIWCKKTTSENSYFHLSRVEFFGKMSFDQCQVPFSIIKRYTCKRKMIESFSLIQSLALILLRCQ